MNQFEKVQRQAQDFESELQGLLDNSSFSTLHGFGFVAECLQDGLQLAEYKVRKTNERRRPCLRGIFSELRRLREEIEGRLHKNFHPYRDSKERLDVELYIAKHAGRLRELARKCRVQ